MLTREEGGKSGEEGPETAALSSILQNETTHIYPSQGPVDFVSQVDELLVSPGVGKISLTS